ncbi:ABC transporter ATP-binding protein [Hominifimenecus sp. rT4P-3]|uniref:ABC transporter ATP-binding protein n=1 Tax=Hominifimenecus sp. rT4P-3 TaxID=3242979 RepID=UPI003DA468A1
METVLKVNDLVTQFVVEGKTATTVKNVSFYLKPGEIIGVVGESGSGKSVTMMSILQLIASPGKVAGGEVYLRECKENILQYPQNGEKMRSIRGGTIGMIFQEPMTSLNPVLTVGYQIQESIMLHLGLGKEDAKAKAIEMLKLVGIPDAESRFNYYAQQFSGGMRQRIMIAMALAAEPDILIADEATTALDVTTQAQLLELLKEISEKKGTSIIIVTHNLGIVAQYADRIYVMYAGMLMETASAGRLFQNPTHPYTRGLLRAIPRLSDPKGRILVPIDGLPPSPAERPNYCPFYNRCQYRMDKCKEVEDTPVKEVEAEHLVRCCLTAEELAEKIREIDARELPATPEKHISDQVFLEVKGVQKYFPVYKGMIRKKIADVKAIEDITFQVNKGETLGIVGESGCGKTTLARCLMRVYHPDKGEIFFDGTDIANFKDKELKPYRPRMQMIFQDPFSSLDPRQTAGSIVGESLQIHKLVKNQEEYDARVDELFRLVGLNPNLKDRVAHEFSGGQRQRLGIARALSSNPSMIICDEPISALDVSIQAQIINLLEELQSKLGITYLFIAHDLAVVKHISDKILVMYLGRIVEFADCEALYENPLHPYTRALLSAVPTIDSAAGVQTERIKLKGEVPSILNRPDGCPFSDRCSYATKRCKQEIPQLIDVGERHQVACFLYQNQERKVKV